MSEQLKLAFDQMATRGAPAGAAAVVAGALADPRVRQPAARHRSRFVALAAVAATVAVVIAGLAVVRSHVPHVERVNVGGGLGDSDGNPETMTVLVVGSDSRTGLDDPRRRADATMLVRVDRATGAVSVLSLPRDLYVPIAGTGSSDRLSTASLHGPAAVLETVRAVTGIAIDHFLEFDFAGFARVVDAVGGVDLRFPEPTRDVFSGLDVPAGCVHLDGQTALAYVTARHLQVQEADGNFHADPTGDIGRIQRQQLLLLVALDQVAAARNPARVDRIARAINDNVRVDEGFSLPDAVDFAKRWANTDGPLTLLTYPFRNGTLDNGAVVLFPEPSLTPNLVETFNNPQPRDPNELRGHAAVSCR